ncbi:MAG: penicillin-binding protein 2 [Anaerolineae bacterium]|jgi:cell division protein FtsI/penicillin-binding protein 2
MSAKEGSWNGAWRLIAIGLVLTFGFSVVVTQIIHYQVIKHDDLAAMAEEQFRREQIVRPDRGTICDIHGYPLALNITEWNVSVSPSLILDAKALAPTVAEILDLPTEEVYTKMIADMPWVPLASNVPQEVGEEILALQEGGLICEPNDLRVYPEGESFPHMIGIVTKAGNGFYGLEGYYEPLLHGSDGKAETELRPTGEELPVRLLADNQAKPGTHLYLTADRNIQFIAERELQNALDTYGADSGTIVIMNPKSGALLASVSYPAYNPNDFAGTDVSLMADPAVSSMWEPGSIFKIITWSAALDAGVISPGMMVYDDGSIEVGGRLILNSDRKAHGNVSITDALVKSLNTVASYISTTLGKDQFYTYLRRFGFGALTDVDLASEGPGMMKQPGDSNWFPSELGTNSFGQGIAVTPIQMITAVSAVANGGLLMQPYVVQRQISIDPETGEERVVQRDPKIVRRAISQETAQTMTQMLVQVIERGATKAQVPGYRVAGKTGTAQIPTPYGYHPNDTIASFVGFAPADDPQFIILVKLDRPKTSPWGSQTAAPTFRAIAERLLIYMQIPPDEIRLAQHQEGP